MLSFQDNAHVEHNTFCLLGKVILLRHYLAKISIHYMHRCITMEAKSALAWVVLFQVEKFVHLILC